MPRTYELMKLSSGWWLKHLLFSLLVGEDSHFDQYFSNGLKPPTCHKLSINHNVDMLRLRDTIYGYLFFFQEKRQSATRRILPSN